jgi:hypothetical protein
MADADVPATASTLKAGEANGEAIQISIDADDGASVVAAPAAAAIADPTNVASPTSTTSESHDATPLSPNTQVKQSQVSGIVQQD